MTPAETLYAAIAALVANILETGYDVADPAAPSRVGQLGLTVAYADLVAVLSDHPERPRGDIHPFVVNTLLDLRGVHRRDGGLPSLEAETLPAPGDDVRMHAYPPLPPAPA